MKKPVMSLLILITVSVLCVAIIAINVNAKNNAVSVTEEVLYGDKSSAQDYTVTTRYQYNNQLFWETEYNMNSGYSTDYSYYNSKQFANADINYQGVDIPSNIVYGFSTDIPAEDQTGIARAFKEMYDSIGNNESTERTIKLIDYYEYYPFTVHFDLPGVWWSSTAYEDLEDYGYLAEKKVCDRFYEFFKIPVSEDDKVTISVGKDMGGISMGMDENCYSIGNANYDRQKTYTSSRAFFSINNISYDKMGKSTGYADMSQIEGGYGIYSIDYQKAMHENDCGVAPASLKTFFPLNVEETVVFLVVDQSEECLIAVTNNGVSSFIYIIDTENAELINKYDLGIGIDGVVCIQKGDYIVLSINQGGRLIVLEKAENGYTLALSVESSGYPLGSYAYVYENTAVHYENGVLAIADNLSDTYGYESCGFYFAVYTKDGLQYYGEYNNSIDIGNWPDNFDYNCFPADIENIVIDKE